MAKKQKTPIIAAVLIPIAMIALVAASIYLPRLYSQPAYDFLYYSDYCDVYQVSNGTLDTKPATEYRSCYETFRPIIYFYNVRTGSRTITLEEARKLALDPGKTSPDGFTIGDAENSGYFFPFYFGSSGDGTKYLKGKGATFKVKLPENAPSYYFTFLGWVIK